MKEKRDQKIVFRVTRIEKNELYKIADQKDMIVSEYVRKRCFENKQPISNKNKTFEYVQLVNAINTIEDDTVRREVGYRLEAFLCLS